MASYTLFPPIKGDLPMEWLDFPEIEYIDVVDGDNSMDFINLSPPVMG